VTSLTDKQTTAVQLLTEKYVMLDTLGGGGMGHVYRARHRQLKRLVAIKLLSQDLEGQEAVTRFLREARAVAQIGSLHVAHVMDADVLANGQPYIVMEYLQGRDLAAWVAADGRLSATLAVDFILQALDAIAEAHALQIIHRDIKPGNLFATRTAGGDTLIKVLDFGLAKTNPSFDTLAPGITERGAVLGTPSYMSPEQFMDAQAADVRSDIWALGATLFELLTGTPPFTGNSLPQVYRAVIARPIPSLRSLVPELPEGLEDVVATCLTRERELRYADVAELALALKPWASSGAHVHAERVRRILERSAELAAPDVSGGLVSLPRAPARPTPTRSFAASRAWSMTQIRRPGVRYSGYVAIALTALIVVWSTLLQAKFFEQPEQGSATMQQLPSTGVTTASSVVDALSRAVDAAVAAPTAVDATPPEAPIEGTQAALMQPAETTPVRPLRQAPKPAAPKNAAAGNPRVQRSVYEQYP
jgi:serine/threonine protein kinase